MWCHSLVPVKRLMPLVFVLAVASNTAAQIPDSTVYVKGSLFLKGPLASVTGLIDVQGFEQLGPVPDQAGAPVPDFLLRGALTGSGNAIAQGPNPDGQSIPLPTAMSCTPCLGGHDVIVGGRFSVSTSPPVVWEGVTYNTAEWAQGDSPETLLLYGSVVHLPTKDNASTVTFRAPLFVNQWLLLSASAEDLDPIRVVLVGSGTARVQFNTRRNVLGQVEYWFDPSSYSIDVKLDPSNGRPCYDRSCFSQDVR